MNNITFNLTLIPWLNNSSAIVTWTNSASATLNWGSSVGNSGIIMADFMRVITPTATYRFATTPSALTIPAVDSQPFDALGTLVKIGDAQRDIKSTANETTATLVGIDTAMLGWVLSQNVKGASVEMWHGFFDTNGALITSGGTGGLYKFFTGYINSFTISEQWFEEIRQFVGAISISASSIQIILQNRAAGRYTNDNAWQFFNAGDTSMIRVPVIQTTNYYFGKDAPPNS
ncbi:hypothetical protein UFOVP17_30 [uncultured Caudovirales phage]|uniref:Uncharacterized protein n=1 Tax=uncultured Caudovirales phage TaxID=2100421 RepID=A0A6J5KJW1_9CAUD|nr:hypothetical protein UFOVP17_30 [uncultured Caudovirales phage]